MENCVGCSSLVPESWEPKSSSRIWWDHVTILGYNLSVERNARTGIMKDIKLTIGHQPRPIFDPDAPTAYVVDYKKGVEFIAHLNSHSLWTSVSPMNKQYRELFGDRPPYSSQPIIVVRNRPRIPWTHPCWCPGDLLPDLFLTISWRFSDEFLLIFFGLPADFMSIFCLSPSQFLMIPGRFPEDSLQTFCRFPDDFLRIYWQYPHDFLPISWQGFQ